MAGFNDIYITTAGAELAVKTLEGKKLEFTVARLGDGTLADSSMDAIKARTGLENTIMEVTISRVKQTSETQATISFVFQNTEASGPFYFREIGIFALDPDTSDEVLFAYSYAGDEAEYINNSVSEIVEKRINIVVTVDNASEVTITLDSSQIYVTEKELEEKLDEYVKQDDLEQDLQEYVKQDDLEQDLQEYVKQDDLEQDLQEYVKQDELEQNLQEYVKQDDLEQDLQEVVYQDDFAILSGTLTVESGSAYGSTNISYPTGFSASNCVVVSVAVNKNDNANIHFGFSARATDWASGSGMNRVTLNSSNITLHTNNISQDLIAGVSVGTNGYSSSTTLSYKIVLLKIS